MLESTLEMRNDPSILPQRYPQQCYKPALIQGAEDKVGIYSIFKLWYIRFGNPNEYSKLEMMYAGQPCVDGCV